MCYDVEQQHWRVVKHLKRFGTEAEYLHALNEYQRKWNPQRGPSGYHLAGFSHPELLIVTSLAPLKLENATWGMIPFWVRSEEQALSLWNQTINARGETLFEKPSFRKAAQDGRCLVVVNSFFEHHHQRKKTFPYRIKLRSDEPMLLGGIYDTWVNRETGEERITVAIVTTTANDLMATIHNNPKMAGPRMPLILNEKEARQWLSVSSKEQVTELIRPSDDHQLEAFAVGKLRGKDAVGDSPAALEPVAYEELHQNHFPS